MLLLSPSCMCDILRNHHDFDAELPRPSQTWASSGTKDRFGHSGHDLRFAKCQQNPICLSLPTHSTSRICTTYSGFILYRFQYLHTALYMFREASGLSFESKGDRTMNLRYDAHATRWETALDTRVPAARFAHKTNRESGHVPSACPSHPQCAGTSRYTAATRRSSLSRRWPTAQLPSQRRPCRHRLAAEVLHHGALAGAESCGKVLCRWQTSAPARSRA